MHNNYFIEPADNLLKLLNKKLDECDEKELSNLFNIWIHSVIDLYNNKAEFILLGNVDTKNNERDIFKSNYLVNYKNMRNGLDALSKKQMSDSELFITVYDMKNDNLIDESNKKFNLIRLITFLFQYLHTFEDKSINGNLWNYCLKSSTISIKSTVIGLFTLICQYIMMGALIYNISLDFSASDDISIILITAISTIISLLYSFDTLQSFINAIPLYIFLLDVYDDYPEIMLDKDKQNFIYFKKRNLNMTKSMIKYNFICDFLSNFILPIIVPIINIFIILNSDDIVDSILNSVAIFYIIQIDEELYTRTDYERDQMSINFCRWILSNIYCRYFPQYKSYFVEECNHWQRSSIRLSTKYRNKIQPNSN